jgi:ankyrin repeat protein
LVSDNLNLLPLGGDVMVPAKRLSLLLLLLFCFAAIATAPALAGKLTDAVKARDVAQVRSLLAAGEDVQEKVRGDYPLNVAAASGPVEMVAVLLEAGADIERPNREGLRPLHNAVIFGGKEIVALLIQKGAKVEAKEKWGRTPLNSFAATGGSDIEIPKILLAAGADPNIESAKVDESTSALQYAAYTGNFELAEMLIAAHADVNHRNAFGWGALHQAVKNGRLEIAQLLIAHGADVNMTNNLGNTPFYYTRNNAAMKQLLMAAGAK